MELDTVICGDCLDVMGSMPDNEIDTIITDPPYGLNFMGRDWDHGVPGPCYWREALRIAKPGAFLLAFGGTRTWHRLACAIEDAGWELRDTVMWVYAQGFPKSRNISKAIDKANGAKRKVVGVGPFASRRPNADHSKQGLTYADDNYIRPAGHAITAPATESALTWDGWGTGLKPAWEPIIVAMKPVDGTFAHNALAWGVAGFWIDGGRVAGPKGSGIWGSDQHGSQPGKNGTMGDGWGDGNYRTQPHQKGRWPANLLLQHADGCRRRGTRRVKGDKRDGSITPTPARSWANASIDGIARQGYADPDGYEQVDDWDCVEGCPVAAFAAQSGERPTSWRKPYNDKAYENSIFPKPALERGPRGHNDSGTAARFFYQAKASRRERNLGCQDVYWRKDKSASIGFVRVSQDEWDSLPEKQRARGNVHPTVKPLGVVEYLCRLTRTPTGGVVFDPFCGTGTMALGAIQTGRRWLCCDNQEDYVYLANLRIEALRRETPQMELAL